MYIFEYEYFLITNIWNSLYKKSTINIKRLHQMFQIVSFKSESDALFYMETRKALCILQLFPSLDGLNADAAGPWLL